MTATWLGFSIEIPPLKRVSTGRTSCHCRECGVELLSPMLLELPYTCSECGHENAQCWYYDTGPKELEGTEGQLVPRVDLMIVKNCDCTYSNNVKQA